MNGMNSKSCIQMQNSRRTSENGPFYYVECTLDIRLSAFDLHRCEREGALGGAQLHTKLFMQNTSFFLGIVHRRVKQRHIQCPRKIIMDFSVNFNAVKTFKQRRKNVSPKCFPTNSQHGKCLHITLKESKRPKKREKAHQKSEQLMQQ